MLSTKEKIIDPQYTKQYIPNQCLKRRKNQKGEGGNAEFFYHEHAGNVTFSTHVSVQADSLRNLWKKRERMNM